MIQLFTWPTPNGQKVQIMLEEIGATYGVTPINILRGSQFAPDFLAISPNNKIPAITDDEVLREGVPVSVFETGAILLYLAEKYGKFLASDRIGRPAELLVVHDVNAPSVLLYLYIQISPKSSVPAGF